MKRIICSCILLGFLIFSFQELAFPQELCVTSIDKITKEISCVFEKNIEAGEKLDIGGITASVDDTLKTGFIDNGNYFGSFEQLMVRVKRGVQRIDYQEMNVNTKKITVLSENIVVLTAHGDYSAKVIDGRVLKGKFAWSFIYSKINGEWKVIHSHMSNPPS